MPCALGALLFQLNGTFAWYFDAPMLPLPFLPLLLWGIERSRIRTTVGASGGAAMIAAATGGSLLAGFPETAYLDGLLGLTWLLLRMANLPRAQAFDLARKAFVGGLLGLAISAPVLLPFLIDLPVSTLGDRVARLAHAHLPCEFAASLLFPYVFGSILANARLTFGFWVNAGGYIGCPVAFLAIAALLHRPNRLGQRLVLGAWIGGILCLSFDVPILSEVLRLVPGFDHIRLSRYGMPSLELAACVLGAMALDDHARGASQKYVIIPAGCVATLGAILILLARHALARNFRELPMGEIFAFASIGWAVASLAALAALSRMLPTPRVRIYLAALIVADAVGLFMLPSFAGLRKSDMATDPIDFLEAHQGLSRAISTDNTLFRNYGALVQLGMVQYTYHPVPSDWANYVRKHIEPNIFPNDWPSFQSDLDRARTVTAHRLTLEDLGVRYVVSPSAMNPFDGLSGPHAPVRVYSRKGLDIFELPDAKPYAEIIGGPCKLTILSREKMDADCQGLAWLVRRELFFHGWRANVNGQAMPILRHGEVFQAIPLPGGHSRIRWHYRPPFSWVMWPVFFAGSACFIAQLWRERKGGLFF
jgi:hypothetical protein